jgi:cytochrome c
MDWMRNWIMTVSFDSINQLKSIEPFMPNTVFERPMDMALGNDGCMYLLEYGTNWFDNKNGKLSKIIYNRNNRNPVVQLSIPNTKGGLPFQLNASAKDSYDPDNDSLTYKWYLNNELLDNHSPLLNYTIEKAGKHELILEISDSKNTKSTKKIDLIIGNNEPILNLKIDGNSTFYNPQSIISFESYATDKEDGNNLLTINELRVVHASFIAQNISSNSIFCRGKKLVETSDCFACHAMNTKSVGPDFITLNNKYEPNEETIAQLSQKVKNGGSGVWGNVAMSAHPQLSNDQTALMVRYILSNKNIENNQVFSKSSSKISQKLSIPLDENLFVKLKSSYTDKGANNMLSHTTSDSILLQYPSLMALSYDLSGDVIETNGLARLPFPGSFVCFKAIDLTLIRSIEFEYSYDFFAPNCEVEIHVDAPTGTLIGKTSVKKINSNSKFGKDKIELIAQNSKKDLYIVYKPALDLHAPINFKKFNFIF